MLNRTICMKCYQNDPKRSIQDSVVKLHQDWEMDYVICRPILSNGFYHTQTLNKPAPERCPFAIEHLYTEDQGPI